MVKYWCLSLYPSPSVPSMSRGYDLSGYRCRSCRKTLTPRLPLPAPSICLNRELTGRPSCKQGLTAVQLFLWLVGMSVSFRTAAPRSPPGHRANVVSIPQSSFSHSQSEYFDLQLSVSYLLLNQFQTRARKKSIIYRPSKTAPVCTLIFFLFIFFWEDTDVKKTMQEVRQPHLHPGVFLIVP